MAFNTCKIAVVNIRSTQPSYQALTPRLSTGTHREPVDGSDFLPYSEHIQQSLCGVFPHSIPSIDHGLPTHLNSLLYKITTLMTISYHLPL